MVFDFATMLILSIADLVVLSGKVFIPVYLVVALAYYSRKYLEKYGLSWIKSTVLLTYAALFILVAALNLLPMLAFSEEATIGTYPAGFGLDSGELLARYLLLALRIAVIPVFLTLLLLPLQLVSAFFFDWFGERFGIGNSYINLAAAVFAAVFLAWVVELFIAPILIGGSLLTGTIFLIFFGLG